MKIKEEVLKEEITAGLTNQEIAEKYGCSVRNIQQRRKHLAEKGFSPPHDYVHPVPDGFLLKGASLYYDKDGKVTQRWVKSKIDPEQQANLIREFMSGVNDDITRAEPVAVPYNKCADNLLNFFPITDYHLGMLAWAEETGDDWDMKIAEEVAIKWLQAAISRSPHANTAILANMGDFLHWDGLAAVTPASKHVLDADTRYTKLVRVAIKLIRTMIQMLLETHQTVHVIMAEGNHDEASSVWLRESLKVVYENEPRLTIDDNPDPYYCYEFGNTAIFVHHGHKKKAEQVDHVLAAKFRKVFGRTEHAYAHVGHLHHLKAIETNLMVVEQHRTLASKDAYASRGGWLSERAASVITYDKEFGEVQRATITPAMLQR